MTKTVSLIKGLYWEGRDRVKSMLRDQLFNVRLLKYGIYPFSAAAKCVWYWERYYDHLRGHAALAGYTVASRNNMIGYKTSDTLFVLGSGPSINSISEDEWKTIAEHNSIGFNYFLAHPFVPTFYHMELRHEEIDIFRNCYMARRDAYQNVPFMINYHFIRNYFKREGLDFVRNKLVTVPRTYTEAKQGDVPRIIGFAQSNIAPADDSFLIHYRGSLCLMISLAVLLGYKKIVLAGVDLNNSTYFYCATRYACEATRLLSDQRCGASAEMEAAAHATADPSFIPSTITIDRVLHILDENMLRPRGIELYVYNKGSLLHPAFPVWRSE